MEFKGKIQKMYTYNDNPVQYYLNLSGDLLHMNSLIEKKITLKHIGYECIECSNKDKIYRMGFCKRCFFTSPYASESIIKPELSKAHTGEEERNIDIEKEIQLVPHFVYLAYTGDIKVGVTRTHQIPTRWIDQGATFALPIAKTNNRYEAGVIEVALKGYLSDKTNYRKMLQSNDTIGVDLENLREKIQEYFPDDLKKFCRTEENICKLDYPYHPPKKISSFTLDKKNSFEGILKGIKGQYLCFNDGDVINIRSHEGYVIELNITK